MTTWTTRTPLYNPLDTVSRAVPATLQGWLFHAGIIFPENMEVFMQFFTSAITTLQTLVVALGAGLGVWGVVNLLEGYGSDNPGSNAHVR